MVVLGDARSATRKGGSDQPAKYEGLTLMALIVLLHRVIRIALQRYCECEPRSILVPRYVISTLALVFLMYPALSNSVRGEQSAHKVSVYSEEQAIRGGGLYAEHCASCHGVNLEGGSSMPLSGATFEERWADEKHSVDDLFYIVRTLMPYGKPASLSKPEYIDIIAYLLKMNGYPAGGQVLPLDTNVLAGITIRPQRP
jgi:mono/diheme cytochrome c family protein